MPVEFDSPHMISDITSVLRSRGLEPKKTGDITKALFPGENLREILLAHGQFDYQKFFPGPFPGPALDQYVDYFRKTSFRKMIRLLLRGGRPYVEIGDLEQASGSSTTEYLEFLERLLLIAREGSMVRLKRDIQDLGPSLEHYVAELCVRELRGSADWGVLLQNLPRSGGDYDVLAWLEPSLMYVECKTARPGNIEERELREFLQRTVELAPDLAIFLIDTDENLDGFVENRINSLLGQAIDVRGIANQPLRSHPDYPGIYFGFSRIYVTNSKKTILKQLQKCLQHYYAHVKGLALWSKPYLSNRSINFTNTPLHEDDEGLGSEDA